MKSRAFLISITSIFSSTLMGQSLIFNSSFEQHTQCPQKAFNEIDFCEGWYDPAGTADYYNLCMPLRIEGTEALDVYYGSQSPHSGNGFAGFYLFKGKNFYDREYLQTEFKEPLQQNVRYAVSFHLCIGRNTQIYSDHISIGFSETSQLEFINTNPNYPNPSDPKDKHGIILSCKSRITLKDIPALQSKEWTLVTFDYVAKGGEKYLTIGSFKEDMTEKQYGRMMKTNIIIQRPGGKIAYYYIDDVSVVAADQKGEFSHQIKGQ